MLFTTDLSSDKLFTDVTATRLVAKSARDVLQDVFFCHKRLYNIICYG